MRFHAKAMAGIAFWIAAAAIQPAVAFEVETEAVDSVVINGETIVVTISGTTFTVVELPEKATGYEFYAAPPEAFAEGFKAVNPGGTVTQDEALNVIKAQYRKTAFNFDSIKIRNFKVGSVSWVTWCSIPILFGCLERQFRAGTLVELEANGMNQSGGMTGFVTRHVLIRKVI
jgi:hypothetical protein